MQKSHVALVTMALPTDDDTVDRGVVGMHVALTVSDGSTRTGSIFLEARADRTRLIDFLNDSPLHFLALFARDQLLAVNRRHVVTARTLA